MDDAQRREQLEIAYRYLDQFIGIYFEEDWFEDYNRDERAAVEAFVSEHGHDYAVQTLAELRRMIAERSPDEFEQDLGLLMRAYSPKIGERPRRAFADRVARWIAESLDEGPAPE